MVMPHFHVSMLHTIRIGLMAFVFIFGLRLLAISYPHNRVSKAYLSLTGF